MPGVDRCPDIPLCALHLSWRISGNYRCSPVDPTSCSATTRGILDLVLTPNQRGRNNPPKEEPPPLPSEFLENRTLPFPNPETPNTRKEHALWRKVQRGLTVPTRRLELPPPSYQDLAAPAVVSQTQVST